MRSAITMLFLLFALVACGTSPHKVEAPILPDLVEVSQGLKIDDKLLQDCKRLPLLPRRIMTRADVVAYNDEWITRYDNCRKNNSEVIGILRRLMTTQATE